MVGRGCDDHEVQEAPQAPAVRRRMLAVPHRQALGFGRGQQRQGQQPTSGLLLLRLRRIHLLLHRLVAVFSWGRCCQEHVLLRSGARRAGADVPEQVGGGGGGEAGAAGERAAAEERDGVLVEADEGGDLQEEEGSGAGRF